MRDPKDFGPEDFELVKKHDRKDYIEKFSLHGWLINWEDSVHRFARYCAKYTYTEEEAIAEAEYIYAESIKAFLTLIEKGKAEAIRRIKNYYIYKNKSGDEQK